MKLSFDDEESFKEAVESLRFNNPASDPNAHQRMGSSGSMPVQDSETRRNEDNIINIIPRHGDPNTPRQVGRSRSILPQERSRDIQVFFNNPCWNEDFVCEL